MTLFENCYGQTFESYEDAVASMDSSALEYSDIIDTANDFLSTEEMIDALEEVKHPLFLWLLEKAWEEKQDRYVNEVEEEE